MSYSRIKRRIRPTALPCLSYEYLEVRSLLAVAVSSLELFPLSTENQIVSWARDNVVGYDISTIQGASYEVSFSYQLEPTVGTAANQPTGTGVLNESAPEPRVDFAVSWNDLPRLTLTATPQTSSATVIVEGRAQSSRLTFHSLDVGTDSSIDAFQVNVRDIQVAKQEFQFNPIPLSRDFRPLFSFLAYQSVRAIPTTVLSSFLIRKNRIALKVRFP